MQTSTQKRAIVEKARIRKSLRKCPKFVLEIGRWGKGEGIGMGLGIGLGMGLGLGLGMGLGIRLGLGLGMGLGVDWRMS
ncbi:hypothetical protein NECID01_1498 [Nematocida sp. AWRm77]|nr:hypothetical protein NECID01_1498 [Nematocida sp. AWRm77]